LRTLFLVGVVVAIILGSVLSGLGAAPSWVGLRNTRTEPAPSGEPGEPGLAAMAKGKRDQKAKSNGGKHDTGKGAKKHQANGTKHGTSNGNKHGKGTSAKHTKDKPKGKTQGKDKHREDQSKETKPGTGDQPGKDQSGDRQRTAAAPRSITVVARADGRVGEAQPTASFDAAELAVDDEANADVESYVRFTVEELTTPVQRATLRLWVPAGGDTTDGPAVSRARSKWAEGTLTWVNRPETVGDVVADTGAIAAGTWVEYDVTTAVTGTGTYTFSLLPQSSDDATFASREGGNPPQLVLIPGTPRDDAADTPGTEAPHGQP
jgi:hypothetical protein